MFITLEAFDLVSWPFMFEIFNIFGLDKKFSLWMQATYSNPISEVKTNCTLSRKFTGQKGTKQGDPLSLPLFAAFIEVLAGEIYHKI